MCVGVGCVNELLGLDVDSDGCLVPACCSVVAVYSCCSLCSDTIIKYIQLVSLESFELESFFAWL